MPTTVLITGGTSGIGRAAAKKCIEAGYTVIITGRSQESLDNAEKFILQNKQGQLYKIKMVLGDFDSIRKCVGTIKSLELESLDVVVHNASMVCGKFEQCCNGKVERTVFENAISPLYLNRLVIPMVEKSSNPNKRILFVSSLAHDPEVVIIPGVKRRDMLKSVEISDFVGNPKTWKGELFYALSKLATVWNAFSLAEEYPSIPIITFCPGFVPTTDINRDAAKYARMFVKYLIPLLQKTTTIERAADGYLYYIANPEINNLSGTYFRYEKPCNSSTDGRNSEKRKIYWKFANDLIDTKLNQEK